MERREKGEESVTTTVELRLPWGRFHATPWDRNVNEGVTEWPPSPWRLLRALYAMWRQRCPQLNDQQVETVLRALSDPPRYWLPTFTLAHTRHYYPERTGKTVKTFDPFVAVARGEAVFVEWPTTLDVGDRGALHELVSALSYLGRADSLVDARLVTEVRPSGTGEWLAPVDLDEPSDTSRLLCVDAPLDLRALVARPLEIRRGRMLTPPGSRWVEYSRAESAIPSHRRKSISRPHVEAVRFAISGAAPTPRNSAVAVGDTLRLACMSQFGKAHDGAVSPVITGKSSDGLPLGGPHGHAHYLPFARRGSDRKYLDTVIVWTPNGFTVDEVAAVARQRRLWAPPHVDGVTGRQLGVEAFGSIRDIAPELFGPATIWRTATPYAPTRHGKQSIDELVAEDVVRELNHRNLPSPVSVRIIPGDWLSFRRHRIKERLDRARRSFGVELIFDRPIEGPIALGQLSHFGLGLFRPVPS